MSKEIHLKYISIFLIVLMCLVLTVTVMQSDVLAGDKESGWFLNDATMKSPSVGYTRVVSTLLVIIALIIATVFVLKKKFGVRANIGRSRKLIKIIDYAPMGAKKSVFLVQVPGKHLMLGVTNDRIELITEIPNEDVNDGSGEAVNKKEFLNLIKKSISERKQL